MSYEDVRLWKTTLGQTSGRYHSEVERLRAAYFRFRQGVGLLAAEIARDLPTFTVHDVTHIDALWGVADTIAGPECTMNPLEAFVLGGAFLLHDLGMGLASWPGRESGVQSHPLWTDTVASLLQRSLHRPPTPEEILAPPKSVAFEATVDLLRQLHAEHAERLIDARWRNDEDGTDHVLLEDEHLRFHLGPLIGKVAHSHWWDAGRLVEEFATDTGAPSEFPKQWIISPLRIALLLRTTDAAHLDDRRAPRLLRAARGIDGYARQHWVFQGHLSQVRQDSGQLVFSATRPFGVDEAEAWWLAYETLQMVDRELHSANGLLATRELPRFAAQSVAGVESPSQLVRFLAVNGWEPVQARVRVGDVAGLVERIGGAELYGSRPTVPLRELIQNASDAVIARRVLEGRDDRWGSITVRLGHDEFGPWVEVGDDGVGMSRALLTGALLDFGESYWGSALCREEHRSLVARGFEPAGRYGIGFFSVFMWGQRVRVTSRPYAEAQAKTMVLEFKTGLRSSPVLRQAMPSEYLRDGGTTVRVWLKVSPADVGGLQYRHGQPPEDLGRLCARLAPALPVSLYVEEQAAGVIERRVVVVARDWETLPGTALLERLSCVDGIDERRDWLEVLGARVRPIFDEHGRTIGRGCITHFLEASRGRGDLAGAPSTVAVGGLLTGSVQYIAGILVGLPRQADRMTGTPVASGDGLKKWVDDQCRLLLDNVRDCDVLHELAGVLHRLGGDITGFPIARASSGWLTEAQIRDVFTSSQLVILVQDAAFSRLAQRVPVDLNAGVLAVGMGHPTFVLDSRHFPRRSHSDWPTFNESCPGAHPFYRLSPVGIVVRALASAWDVSESSVWRHAQFSDDYSRMKRVVGSQAGLEVLETVHLIHRPPRSAT